MVYNIIMCPAGIPAAKYSHVKYFLDRPAYDDYYDLVDYIGEIGVITFADQAQALLVDYLRDKYGNACADWCRDVWTGKRGRICLAHTTPT